MYEQDAQEERPKAFQDSSLFILPIRNGEYAILRGEGYIDVPSPSELQGYRSKLDFELEMSRIGNSKIRYLDYAYAVSILSILRDL
ncbi:MAG: hypothetical protein RMJ66_08670 [Bacteroidia bacterium]|nr:hypothetical protein [Bacteroidia bacterium]